MKAFSELQDSYNYNSYIIFFPLSGLKMYMLHFVSLFILNGHLGSFYLLVAVNNADLSIL